MMDMLSSVSLSAQNPWPGLRAFTEADSEFFFGREREAADVVNLIKRARVVLLYGQSGLGKTSLLQAGVFPQLKRMDFIPLRLRFDHGESAPSLSFQLKQALTSELDVAGVTAPRPRPVETLWEYFHSRDLDFWGPRNRLLTPVIVLDQFEEVFTLGQRSDRSAARIAEFASDLESVLEHRPPESVREHLAAYPEEELKYDLGREEVKFVLSLREDFLPHLDPWRARLPTLLASRFRLERMSGAQALEAVERGGGNLVETVAAREIVDFVSSSQRKRGSRVLEQRDIEPALLSVVCEELNRHRQERCQQHITLDLLSGEREAIIQSFYERAFDGLNEGVRDWVERELLTGSGYRDRGALEDALRLDLPEAAFDQLVDCRILHREEREGVVWLELTHDLLTDPAVQSRTLREQRRQADAAAEREAAYKHQLRRSRALAAVFAALLVVSGFAFYRALKSSSRAQIAEQKATQNAQSAKREQAKAQVDEQAAIQSRVAAEKATQDLGLNPIEEIGKDLRAQTATILEIIRKTDASYGQLTNSGPSPQITAQRAHFLATASGVIIQTGRIKDAFEYSQRALDLLRTSGTSVPAGDLQGHIRAEAYLSRGTAYFALGRLNQAVGDLVEARTTAKQVLRAGTSDNLAMKRVEILADIGLGDVANEAWQVKSAKAHFDDALNSIAAQRLSGSEVESWRALALRGKGAAETNDSAALRLYEQASAIGEHLVEAEPRNLRWRSLAAALAYRRAFYAYRLLKYGEAEQSFNVAEVESEGLCQRDPDNLDWCMTLAGIRRGLGLVYQARGETERSRLELEDVLDRSKQLYSAQRLWALADYLYVISLIERSQSPALTPESSMELLTTAEGVLKPLLKQVPEFMDFHRLMAMTSDQQGRVRAKQGKNEDARRLFRSAIETLQRIGSVTNTHPDAELDLAIYYWDIGDALRKLKLPRDALSSYQQANSVMLALVKNDPLSPSSQYNLATGYISSGDAFAEQGKFEDALAQFEAGVNAAAKAVSIVPDNVGYLRLESILQGRIADIRRKESDFSSSLNSLNEAASSLWKALQIDPSDETLNQDLESYKKLAGEIRSAITGEQQDQRQTQVSGTAKTALLQKLREFSVTWDPAKFLQAASQRAWDLAPLMPGEWRILSPNEQLPLIRELGVGESSFSGPSWLSAKDITAVRRLRLDFYQDAVLYELQVRSGRRRGVLSFVRNRGETVFLDGTSPPIHNMNKTSWPKLDTPDRALSYLRFFVGSLGDSDGYRFKLIDQPEDLHWTRGTQASMRRKVADNIKPLVIQPGANSQWQATGTVQYHDIIYYANFHLTRDGMVNMAQDSPDEDQDLPIIFEVFRKDGIREQLSKLQRLLDRIEDDPHDEEAIKSIPQVYFDEKRWTEAAAAQAKWIELVRQKEKDPSKLAERLPREYVVLSWYQLFARKFSDALESSESGLKLNSDLGLHLNRAHALLFLGRIREAEGVYLKYEDQEIASSHKTWKQTALQDLDELEKAGITRPEVADVKKLLGKTTSSAAPGGVEQKHQ